MSINTCETKYLQYVLNTLGLGISTSISAYAVVAAIYFTLRTPTPRKLFILATGSSLLITSIIFSSFIMDSQNSQTRSVLVASILFLRVSLALLSSTGILRYTIFLSEKRRMLINHILCGCVSVVIMYVFAVDATAIASSDNVLQTVSFTATNACQIIIPIAHLILGVFSIYQSSKQKVGVTVRSQRYLHINITFSALIIVVWAAYLVSVIQASESVGLGVALLTILVHLESNVCSLTETNTGGESPTTGAPKR